MSERTVAIHRRRFLASALRDMLIAWEQTQWGWSDQARVDFEKDYLDELKSKILSGAVQVPVPTQDTIGPLRAQYEGTFTFKGGIPLTWIIAGAALVLIAGGVYFFVKRKPAPE